MRINLNGDNLKTTVNKKQVTLSYLFFTFLKIGFVSFGGHMALISVVQRVMTEQDETVDNDLILNSIGIASLLPGPLAVNVVGQIGYHLRKATGAAVSTVAVILPAFVLMLSLSWFYFSYLQTINWNVIMTYVAGAVSAIILASGLQLYKKEIIGNFKKALIFVASLAVMIFTGNYLATIALILLGSICGILFKVQTDGKAVANASNTIPAELSSKPASNLLNKVVLILLLINQVLFFSNVIKNFNSGYFKILLIFSGISLSLFGGGYVMIPIMQSLFVNELHWLNSKEFVDAIAFSQATPGPILISATFIGYKVAGFAGAFIATAAIFSPSVFLVVSVSKIINKYSKNNMLINMLGGIKSVVVALIIVSAYKIIANQSFDLLFVATIAVSFILNFWYKVNPVYLILGSVMLGIVKHLL